MIHELSLVLALADDGTIGHAGGIPWDLPADRRRFRDLTTGHTVIMGRMTWESLPSYARPLKGRRNLVVSRSLGRADDASVWSSLETAIAWARFTRSEPFIIGGVKLYEEALPLATRVYLTEVYARPNGDTKLSWDRAGWKETERTFHSNDAGPEFSFVTLERD